MEKYRSSTDAATGIHPFLPPSAAVSRGSTPFAACVLGALVLAPVWLPVVLVWLVLDGLHMCGLRDAVAGRALLSMLGGANLLDPTMSDMQTYKPAGRRRRTDETTPTQTSDHEWIKIRNAHGALVVVNTPTPLAVLLLSLKISPTFVVPAQSGCGMAVPASHVVEISTRQAVLLASAARFGDWRRILLSISCGKSSASSAAATSGQTTELSALLKQKKQARGGPVVIFAEGMPTNGRGVARFAFSLDASNELRGKSDSSFSMFACGFLYELAPQAVPRVEVSRTRYFVRLLGSASFLRPLRICMSVQVVPEPGRLEHARAALAQCVRLPLLNVGTEERERFESQWAEANK
ncbi:hypothetical protein FVE85_8734 [Porphyridium purpureum]|uniref:Uncharacterized protein n=1 Tax=Porphyridium purpureum TaxID=35688 RepID=A0A5J4YPB5_PORPP|nr:hypothetical protein FVE85_8734 [Porphyridium purpureum]|eukprot:POR1925..scf296_7